MKILIATGIYPPDVGGPANYAKRLTDEFKRLGHTVDVVSYQTEKSLPTGVRHLVYFFRTVLHLHGVNVIIALDTFSVGLPAVCAAKIFGKKIIVRVGGDFLWESYVERTKEKVLLSEFYKTKHHFTFKEKVIFNITKFTLKTADIIAFSTLWQKNIFALPYELDEGKISIVKNCCYAKKESVPATKKTFLWAGRKITLKNIKILEEAFDSAKHVCKDIELDLSENIPRDELLKKIQCCYAVVLPSLSEVSPNFILEAIMYNKPFIMTKDTGFYNELKDVGNFVDSRDAEQMKLAILSLVDEKKYTEQQRQLASFDRVHTYQDISQDFLDIIHSHLKVS